jgi:zinc transport system substrate-binding protein
MARFSRKTNIAIAVMVAAIAVSGTTFAVLQSNTSTCQLPQGNLPVAATFFPQYDFARNIGADKISLSLIVPMTVDVHEFEPTPCSIQQVSASKVLIYNGAGLEPWVPQIINAAANKNLVIVNASQNIQLLPVASQFQQENRTFDPHVWLDPVLAKKQVSNILQGLINADPTDKQFFTANAQAYDAKLDLLNKQIITAISNATTTHFVTFHTAFGYFAQEYGLDQIPVFGPFEEEPTPTDIQNVVNAIHTYHLCYVGYESLENPAIPQAIAQQTNATLIRMDPIEGLSTSEQAQGQTYLTLMQEDTFNIELALTHVGCS